VCKLFAFVAAILLILVTLCIGYVIFARAVGFASPAWTVQFTEYALLWITFLGTAWVLGTGRHVAIDVVTSHLTPRMRGIFGILHSLVGCGVCGVLCWYGLVTTGGMYQRGVTDVQVVDVAKYQVLLVIPLGFFLLALQFFRQAVIGFHSIKSPGQIQGETAREDFDASS
jgi:TRAP-type C4-dicarboxylate transport system permease small subunit